MDKRKTDEDEIKSPHILKRAKFAADEKHEDSGIRYRLMQPLEHLAAVRVAIDLWSRASVQDEIKELCRKISAYCRKCRKCNEYLNLNEFGQDIKNKVLDTVLGLSEFDVIRKILSGAVNCTGQEIFDWVDYHDRYVFFKGYTKPKIVNNLDCLVWTSRGIIDYKETAKMLLAKKRLFEMDSYSLACTYCLENEATILAPSFGHILIKLLLKHKFGAEPMLKFWSAHLKGDFTYLTQEVSTYNKKHKIDYSINEYVFQELTCNEKHRNNQAAIKFMWDRLNDKEKSRQIYWVMKYSKTDLKCLFLSQMNEVQQQQAFMTEGRHMLLCLLDDWLWKDYFLSTIHHVWSVIPSLDFLCVVEDIVEHRMENLYEHVEEYNRYKGILKELWRSAPFHLKEFIFEYQSGSRGCGIFFGLLCGRNMDLIQLMLPDINDVQKKAVIVSSPRNNQKCYWLIINDQIDVVERFIDDTLFAEKDVEMFKQKLVESHGCDIAVLFIQNKNWDDVDRFMRWAFKSDHDKKEFKAKLSYSKICDDILESNVVKNNLKGLVELDNFFLWCASGCIQKVVELKFHMYGVYFTKVQCKLIDEDRYKLLESFTSWCFSNHERRIERSKHCFYTSNYYIDVVHLVLNLVEKNDHLQSLEKFLRWCFDRKSEFTRFKRWILQPGYEDEVGVCVLLLCKGMFELSDEFVHWCCSSSQINIRKFKNKLMLCDKIKCLFSQHNHDGNTLQKVIKWFDPSLEIFFQFKKKFEDFRWLEDSDMAAHFIRNQKWGEADQFIQRTFESDNEKIRFRKNLAYGKIRDEILESIVENNHSADFKELENFLQWCVSGDAVKMSLLKDEYDCYFWKTFSGKLILEDNYQLIEQYFNWLGWDPTVVKRFYGYRDHIPELVTSLVEKDDQLQSLEKFVHWCFTKTIEINSFKKWSLKPDKGYTDSACFKLLSKGMFELADEFVRWCCNSHKKEICNFKVKLLLYDGVESVFRRFQDDDERFKKLVKWFNPSMEIRSQFINKFEDLGLLYMQLYDALETFNDPYNRYKDRNICICFPNFASQMLKVKTII